MLSCVGTLALFVSAVTPISTVTAPVAEAAPQTRQLITPIGYKMVNGKQDRENPLSAPDLLVDPGYSETRPNFGDQENNEDVIGTDDRYEVKDATQYPYRWVGTLTFTLESGKRVSCTGSLIGPDSVVTSGHCLSDKFTDMTFSPGQNGDSKPFGTANVTQVWMDENKRSEQDIERDWAVAKLDQPLGNKAGWFGMNPSMESQPRLSATRWIKRRTQCGLATVESSARNAACSTTTRTPTMAIQVRQCWMNGELFMAFTMAAMHNRRCQRA